MVESLDKLLANNYILSTFDVPVENVPGVVGLVVLHSGGVAPDAGLDEMHLHVLLSLELNRKPYLFNSVQLVNELEERPFLKHFVAELVFDVCEHLEELYVVDLRVS